MSDTAPDAAKEPSPPLLPSKALNDKLTTQSSRLSSGGAATDGTRPANDTTSFEVHLASTQPQPQLLGLRHASEEAAKRPNDVTVATPIDKPSRSLEKYLLPADLQDPILSERRYRIVKILGEGSYGKVFLAWDERRQYVNFLN